MGHYTFEGKPVDRITFCYNGDAIDITPLLDNLEYVPDDDEIPFCEGPCDDCPECDQLDDYEVVDEDGFDGIWGSYPPFWGVPDIKRIVFNDPATIVFWDDGTKTVFKTCEGDKFERYMGFAMACMKKMFGSTMAAKNVMEEFDTENMKLWREEAVKPKQDAPQSKEKKTKEPTLYNLIESLLSTINYLTESKGKDEDK